jgi:hypothetical protein
MLTSRFGEAAFLAPSCQSMVKVTSPPGSAYGLSFCTPRMRSVVISVGGSNSAPQPSRARPASSVPNTEQRKECGAFIVRSPT